MLNYYYLLSVVRVTHCGPLCLPGLHIYHVSHNISRFLLSIQAYLARTGYFQYVYTPAPFVFRSFYMLTPNKQCPHGSMWRGWP